MTDYILKFPSKLVAEQFGIVSGFASEIDGKVVSNIASHEHALYEVGEHDGDSFYWVLFRDLVGIPIPAGGEQFIYWSSQWAVLDENGDEISVPRPIDDPNVPNIWWA